MSFAVVYRSDARLDNALRQMRSSSFGMPSSYWRGGRGSKLVICSMRSACESAWKGWRPGKSWPLADILLPQSQSEIRHKGFAARVQQDVARLDVPMNQPLLVGI